MLLAYMSGSEGMICCVCAGTGLGEDGNGVKRLSVTPDMKQKASCGLKAAVKVYS